MNEARTLEHPLPPGMRDLLPEEAASRRAISRAVIASFSLHGYRLVTPPAFEFASVLERGLGTLATADVLRFIEPESGEVAVLRPDMTPQVARIVATRMKSRPPPYRISYEGTVVRRRIGRAKKHRQIPQVGVELCGVASIDADLEILELAAATLRAAGLTRFTIDIGDAGIMRSLLEGVSEDRAHAITRALRHKDEAVLSEIASDQIAALARLHGKRPALEEAVKILASTPARLASERLLALYDAACARGLSDVLSADAGEVRGFAYYTGMTFTIFADGPGEPIGAGGRYDELLARFGAAMPAVGLGIDLDALAWALRVAAATEPKLGGVVVVGPPNDPRLAALRARGVAAVAVGDESAAEAYAASWGFERVLREGEGI